MQNVIRSFGAEIDDVRADERSIVAKISTGELDRYRTVIKSAGVDFANYRKNPVVLFEHGKSPVRGTLPIGRNLWVKPDGVGNGRILAKTIFAKDEFSDLLFSFYKDGTMRGWSISILPEDVGPPSRDEVRSRPEMKDCELVYRSSEMLEYSAVGIPGAADCLSDPELRSLSTLVVRGFWTPPDDVKPLVEPIVERMSESTCLADGGALVEDDAKPKKKRSADDGEEDEEDDDEAADRSMDDESGDDAEPESPAEDAPVERDAESESADEPAAEVVQRDAEYYHRVFHYALGLRGMTPDEVHKLTIRQFDMLDQERRAIEANASVEESLPVAEPEPKPEPEPVDISDAVALIEQISAWRNENRTLMRDFAAWLRGEA
jgi:hypothetical protein